MEKKSATRPHSPKPHGVVINPLLVATIQRLPQKTTESTFPSPGTVSPRAAFHVPPGPSNVAMPLATFRTVQPLMVVGLVSGKRSQGSPCAEWCGDVGSQAVRLVLRTSQRTSPRSSRPLTPRALRCCFRSRHRIKPAHGLWLKARAPLGRHQWPAFANRLVECQSTCPRGRHGERRSWNAASNLSAEPRWIRV
jgi:hypothetical protein